MPHSTHSTIDLSTNHSLKPQLTSSITLLPGLGKPATRTQSGLRTGTEQGRVSHDKWKRSSQIIDAHAEVVCEDSSHPRTYVMPGERNSVSLNGGSLSSRRTQLYEEQFQYKNNVYGSARERVHRESPVIAELRTNVIIKDEFTLVTDLSYHLAARYSRPDSSIMINVDHSSCLALAGTFEPCYILTVTTVPSQMQATTNKRNAALIQSFMADILCVPPDRGIVKFVAIPEENYAINGNTMLGEIERLERQQTGDGSVKRAFNDARKSMPSFNKSAPSLDTDFTKDLDKDFSKINGISSKAERRKSSSRSISAESVIPNVFELAGSQSEERPSTAHSSYAALNGLRLNGVSKEELNASHSRSAGARPNTFAGQSILPEPTKHDPLPKEESPERPKSQHQAPKPDFVKTDEAPVSPILPKKSNIPVSPKPLSRPSSRSQNQPLQKTSTSNTAPAGTKGGPPNTYLDNITTTKRPDSSAGEKHPGGREPAANTAKRRSTITATPRMASANSSSNSNSGPAPAPPPIPESRAPKVSKRKSFLSAFRR